MTEFFIYANSFAAPFFSDTSETFVDAETPEAALAKFAAEYRHPAGLYAAVVYADANAYHKRATPLAKWLCNHEIEKTRIIGSQTGYSYRGNGPGDFEISGKRYTVENPKEGRIVQVSA